MTETFIVSADHKPSRLDRALRDRFPAWGRRAVQTVVNAGRVSVNGQKVWLCSWTVRSGDRIEIRNPPAAKPTQPDRFDDGWLIHHGDDLIVVNKPAGLLSEPTRWSDRVNLLTLATARFGPLTLFHRLDRDTSGVILFSRTGDVNRYLDRIFQERLVTKEYTAIIAKPNPLEPAGTITARLAPHPQRRDMMTVVARGGKHAVTRYQVYAERDDLQQLLLWPETGRTHQLRVHLAHLGAPILGDILYGPRTDGTVRLMLHASRLSLPELSGFPASSFVAPLPPEFLTLSEPSNRLVRQPQDSQ